MRAYPAALTPDPDGGFTVTFRDVPEAITEGRGETDVMAQAQDALGLALLTYPARNLALPKSRARGSRLMPTAV